MAATSDILRTGGIRRPDVTITEAAAAGLDLSAACVVLLAESSGGQMIYGRDGSPRAARSDAQGVIYQFGGPVTKANYQRFRTAQKAGLIPRQGVGDCQLTSEEFIARAEQIGAQRGGLGPWDPAVNQASGFIGLAQRIARYGERNGFRAYNGSGPAAEAYADRAMTQLATWRQRLAGAAPATTTTSSVSRTLTYGMVNDDDVARLQRLLIAVFPGYPTVKALAKVGPTGNYLGLTAAAVLEFQTRAKVCNADGSAPDGRTVGTNTTKALAPYGWR